VKGQDVVSDIRRERNDPVLRRIPSFFANRILRALADVSFTDFGCSFQVMRGDLVRAHGFGPYKRFNNVLVTRSAGRRARGPLYVVRERRLAAGR
jgi:hypothetical protein